MVAFKRLATPAIEKPGFPATGYSPSRWVVKAQKRQLRLRSMMDVRRLLPACAMAHGPRPWKPTSYHELATHNFNNPRGFSVGSEVMGGARSWTCPDDGDDFGLVVSHCGEASRSYAHHRRSWIFSPWCPCHPVGFPIDDPE